MATTNRIGENMLRPSLEGGSSNIHRIVHLTLLLPRDMRSIIITIRVLPPQSFRSRDYKIQHLFLRSTEGVRLMATGSRHTCWIVVHPTTNSSSTHTKIIMPIILLSVEEEEESITFHLTKSNSSILPILSDDPISIVIHQLHLLIRRRMPNPPILVLRRCRPPRLLHCPKCK